MDHEESEGYERCLDSRAHLGVYWHVSKHKSAKGAKPASKAEVAETPKDKSPYVGQRDKLSQPLHIKARYEVTPKQQQLIDIILDKDTKVVFVSGPAGTAKTLIGVYAGLLLLDEKRLSDIVYVRSAVESASRSLGFLSGPMEEKFEPYLMPLNDKLVELLPAAEIAMLHKEKRVEGMPINFLRGASMNVKYILADESQNLDMRELTTLITRLGQFSKLVICGDPLQSDINGKSGFTKMCDLFNDEESRSHGIHYFSFTREDIVRSKVLRYIMERIEGSYAPPKVEPMFPPAKSP